MTASSAVGWVEASEAAEEGFQRLLEFASSRHVRVPVGCEVDGAN
jgi:hypothetical protein